MVGARVRRAGAMARAPWSGARYGAAGRGAGRCSPSVGPAGGGKPTVGSAAARPRNGTNGGARPPSISGVKKGGSITGTANGSQAQRNDSGFPRGVTCTQDSHASQLKHPRSSLKALSSCGRNWQSRPMTSPSPSDRGYRFPPEIISHAVWLYHRAPQQAVGKMTEGPSKSAVRSRLQTTPSGCHEEWRS